MPPPPERKRARNSHHIPEEMIEEILLNLPIKSLTRFGSVTKAWNSMISHPQFMKRYRAREREFLLLCGESPDEDSTCLLSSISSDNITPVVETTATTGFPSLFEKKHPQLLAVCDELLLGHDHKSCLLLWNPSTRRCKKLPDPLFMAWPKLVNDFTFGLGYDSVGEDFKILKIPPGYTTNVPAEVYSLRRDSWREIQCFPADIDREMKGVFASGKLHWWPRRKEGDKTNIIWFDLSTEKFGEVAELNYPLTPYFRKEMSALRGKLCMCLNYYDVEDIVCVVWVMEGESGIWSNKFSVMIEDCYRNGWITPLYVYDNGEILVRVNIGREYYRIYVYKDENITKPKEVIGRSCGRIRGGFLCTRLQPSGSSSLLTF